MANDNFLPGEMDAEEAAKKRQQANAGAGYQWNADNAFNSWDLNPLAQEVGGGADGVRDTLASNRDAYLKPYYANYRAAVGEGNSADDDYGLFNDSKFQNYVRTGELPTQQPQTVTQAWSGNTGYAPPTTGTPGANDQTNQRADDLYSLLKGRATQALTVDPNDPTIRTQTDAYSADQTRAMRDYLADTAEGASPNANLRGEQRMAAEKAGQNTATFRGTLMNQQLQAKRDEIASALQQMGSTLSQDKQLEMQGLITSLDNAIKSRGLDLQKSGQDLDWKKALMNNDEFLRSLGLQEWVAGNDDYYRRAGI